MSKLTECIDYYDRDGNLLGTDLRTEVLARQEKESRETGDTNISVNCVMLFLLNTKNQVYVCKRARDKAENPNLWDKTLGGHVQTGFSFDETLKDELNDELTIDVEILENNTDLFEHLKNRVDLTQKAIVSKVRIINQDG